MGVVQGEDEETDEAKERFAVAEGDAVTTLNVHAAWCKHGGAKGAERAGRAFAEKNMLSYRALVRAGDVREQLARHARRLGLPSRSAGRDHAKVRRAITAGFFANAATLAPHGGGAEGFAFRAVGDALCTSVLFRARPSCVVASVGDEREARDVTAVAPVWLPELAPHFYRTNDRSGNERAPEDAVVF